MQRLPSGLLTEEDDKEITKLDRALERRQSDCGSCRRTSRGQGRNEREAGVRLSWMNLDWLLLGRSRISTKHRGSSETERVSLCTYFDCAIPKNTKGQGAIAKANASK